MARKGDSPQKRQDALIALALRGRGSSSAGGSFLIFPSIAAMEAFNIGTPVTKPGSIAVVTSNGSVWGLGTGTEGDADGITIATTTGGSANQRWLRSNTNIYLPIYLAQRDWFVSSAGNDEAAGDSTHPVKHAAEIYRRWGYDWEANLTGVGTFTVHHLTPSTDGTDPTYFAPNLEDGASFAQLFTFGAPEFTGSLNVVTAKDHATNTALSSTVTTTTGAPVVGMIFFNATRGGSRAEVVRDLGGGNFLLSQPLTPYTGGFPTSTLVDTWAHGDAITGFIPLAVDIARAGAKAATLDGSFSPAHLIQNIAIIDGNDNSGSLIVDSTFAAFEDATAIGAIPRSVVNNAAIFIGENFDCAILTGFSIGSGSWTMTGGVCGADNLQMNLTSTPGGSQLFIETILQGAVVITDTNMGSAYVHTGGGLVTAGDVRMFGSTSSVYGPGLLNVEEGCFNVEQATATVGLPIANLQINGKTTAYSFATNLGTTTVHGGIGLTPTALDNTPASNVAFGGFAFAPGACISLAGVQP